MERGVPNRSVTRAIAALQAINQSGSLSMMAIARATDLPYATASRLVQTLLYEGLIEQEPSRKRYRPTALVQSLSHGFQRDDKLVHVARPHIEALTRDVGWPVSLAVRVGRNMMLRDSTHSTSPLTFEHYYAGFTLPILDSASGKVALAFAPEEERLQILKWMGVAQEIQLQYLKTAEIGLDVEKVRALGFAVQGRNYYNNTPGKTSSIAVPVLVNGGYEASLAMIIFVSAMSIETAVERYLDKLKTAAAQIGLDLTPAATDRPAESSLALT